MCSSDLLCRIVSHTHHHPHYRLRFHAHYSLHYTDYLTVAGPAEVCCNRLAVAHSTAEVVLLFEELPVLMLGGLGSQSFRGTSEGALLVKIQPEERWCNCTIRDSHRSLQNCHECTPHHAHDRLPLRPDHGSPAHFPGRDEASHLSLWEHDVQFPSLVLSPMVVPFRS